MSAPLIVGHQLVADVLVKGGVDGAVTASGVATVVRVGATNLNPRKLLRIYNNGSATIWWGFIGVTVDTGEPISVGEGVCIAVGPDVDIYLIASSGSHNVRIKEGF